MKLLHPFPPVAPQGARVLVLGTFPSAESVKAGGYYGHPRNAFWPIMADVLETPWLTDPPGWQTRYMALRLNLVGLWDVISSCDRKDSSSDTRISDFTPADVWNMLARLPDVRGVILNGRLAWDIFARWTAPYMHGGPRVIVCPSTSPRHAVPSQAKLVAWRRAFREVLS